MCLAKAFYDSDKNQSIPIMEEIQDITVHDGEIILTSLFGETESLRGELMKVDFDKSKIIIKRNK